MLYFTGRQHAGANFADVLQQRAPELPSPIQMCDGHLDIDFISGALANELLAADV